MPKDFDSVAAFHEKFGLATVKDGPPRELDIATTEFRIKFMLEELKEYASACGYDLWWSLVHDALDGRQDLPIAADSLVDLVYVALGTAQLHQLPWPKLFAEVQKANMSKERCKIDHKFEGGELCQVCGAPKVEHSLRGSSLDVIKPKSWTPPRITEVLLKAGWPGPRLPLK